MGSKKLEDWQCFISTLKQYENLLVFVSAGNDGKNIDKELIDILFKPTQGEGAPEAFRGFINLFDDYLAPDLLKNLNIPTYLIWGEKDPWEPVAEAKKWFETFECIKSLDIISDAGHCPHDEMPEKVNPILKQIIQEAI